MATIKSSPPLTIKLDKFIGINEDTAGETQLQLGESPNMSNFRITDNFKLQKREGYKQLFASIASSKAIRCMLYTKINSTNYFCFVCNGKFYTLNLSTNAYTEVGTLTDAVTSMFNFEGKLYILNGVKYYSWDGTTYGEVVGYVPTVYTATPPSGGGTKLEDFNVLSNAKKQLFSGNNSATLYQLVETGIASVDVVKVGGVTKTVTTDYTVNLTNGTVTFNTAPATGVNNVEIQWSKNNGNRAEIEGCKYYTFFGGNNDTRVFLWGNSTYKNRRYNSYIYDPTYFPEDGYVNIGSDEFSITDISRQYDRQIIFKENETFYSYYDETNNIFPVFNLNSEKGNIVFGQSRVINNNPISINEGIYEWVQSNVRDERNATYISKNVQTSLNEVDLSTAVTYDYEQNAEYFLCIGKVCWIYNYRIGLWYKFEFNDTPSCFYDIGGTLYMGTTNGQIMKFDTSYLTDNETAITATWESDFMAFDAYNLKKFINKIWVSLKAESKAKTIVTYETNVDPISDDFECEYNLWDFSSFNFADATFYTNLNPQPFMLKIKAKKFVYLKLKLESSDIDKTATILNIVLNINMGGESK